MASYHLSVQIIGRSDGRSVIAAAAYRSATRLEDHVSGVVHDYRRKRGVVSTWLIPPLGAPAWAADRQELWSRVELKELRRNSQMAREIVVALPHELTVAAATDILLNWVGDVFVSQGMVADVAVHDPRGAVDVHPSNRHAHVLLTTRALDKYRPDGWASNKNRAWNDKAMLLHWRQSWAERQNEAFDSFGLDVRVDHRTLSAQHTSALLSDDLCQAFLLLRRPEPRLGVAAGAMLQKGKHSDRSEALRLAREERDQLARLLQES